MMVQRTQKKMQTCSQLRQLILLVSAEAWPADGVDLSSVYVAIQMLCSVVSLTRHPKGVLLTGRLKEDTTPNASSTILLPSER